MDFFSGLEDYSEDVLFDNKEMGIQLQRLNSQLKYCTNLQVRKKVANVVADMLLHSCLVLSALVYVPGKHDVHLHYDYSGGVYRHWIQGLPPDLVEESIKEFRIGINSKGDFVGLKHSILLCEFDMESYVTMTHEQRMAHLSLINFYGPLRVLMKNDDLVKRVCASPHLKYWMLACSGMDEQYWLNTCETAARNDMIAIRVPTVAHCIVLGREICKHIRQNQLPKCSKTEPWTKMLWYCCTPSVHSYCTKILDETEDDLNILTERANQLLEKEITSTVELHGLVHDWNWILQRLSTIFYSEEPVVLSKKLFSNNWQPSAKFISFPCLLSSFLPFQPLITQRKEGTAGEYPASRNWFTWRDRISPSQYPEFKDLAFKMDKMTVEKRNEMLLQLWNFALLYGGIVFASKEFIWGLGVGHLNVLYALKMEKSGRFFLVCDAEITNFKWLTFDEMYELIISPKVNFSLFDV